MTRLMRCPREHPSRLCSDLPHQTRQPGPSRAAALQIPQLAFSFLRVPPTTTTFLFFFFFPLLLSQHSLCLAVEIQKLLVFNLASCCPDSEQKIFWDCVETGRKRKRCWGKGREKRKRSPGERGNTQNHPTQKKKEEKEKFFFFP